ncbi:Uncharacterised protein [Enterobacter hormaechei]|nr:Uncharacterised protein [Enterobacter hormaechei]
MMSLWDALRMNMMISYQELVRTFLSRMAFKAECDGAQLGQAQGKCAGICFEFIERRRKEITGLVDTIGN